MGIAATCLTIGAILAGPISSQSVDLTGRCTRLVISARPSAVITVNAARADIAGLTFKGAKNIRWVGGSISAEGGGFVSGPAGYGLRVYANSENITVDKVRFTNANRGIVGDGVTGLAIVRNNFVKIAQDAMILSKVTNLLVQDNVIADTIGKPSECDKLGQITEGLSARVCTGLGGRWTDGFHADAVQMRNGVTNALIAGNRISGKTQGIGQQDGPRDEPLSKITIENNIITTDGYHQITLGDCSDCIIRNNTVRRYQGSMKKAIIRPGSAITCGNDVEDARSRDPKCK